jgi:hypothetical protein
VPPRTPFALASRCGVEQAAPRSASPTARQATRKPLAVRIGFLTPPGTSRRSMRRVAPCRQRFAFARSGRGRRMGAATPPGRAGRWPSRPLRRWTRAAGGSSSSCDGSPVGGSGRIHRRGSCVAFCWEPSPALPCSSVWPTAAWWSILPWRSSMRSSGGGVAARAWPAPRIPTSAATATPTATVRAARRRWVGCLLMAFLLCCAVRPACGPEGPGTIPTAGRVGPCPGQALLPIRKGLVPVPVLGYGPGEGGW